MFVRLCKAAALLSAALLAALPATASTITSNNGADNIGFSSASSFGGLGWMPLLSSGTEADDTGFWSPATSFVAGGATFGVSGANGVSAGSIEAFSSTPIIITPPSGDSALTGIALELTTSGTVTIQLTLSDNSTVSVTSTGSGGWVSFTSPLQITAIQLSGGGNTFTLQDFSTGTANPLDLPIQPGDSAPESASMWLAGGGLIVLSRFLRRRCDGA